MARRRNLDESKAAPFTAEAGKVPFNNPRNLQVAQEWMKDNGGTALYGIFICDLYGRWTNKPHEKFSRRKLQADWLISRPQVRRVIDGVIALAGLELTEIKTQHGIARGFTLARVVEANTDSARSDDDEMLNTYSACIPHVSDAHGDGSAEIHHGSVEIHHGSTQPRHMGLHSPTSKTSSKTLVDDLSHKTKSLSNDQDLSRSRAQADARALRLVDRKREEEIIRNAVEAVGRQQQLRGKQFVGEELAAIQQAPASLLTAVAAEGLTLEQVTERLCSCMSWMGSQHWVHKRPYPNDVVAALAAHLRGQYDEEPSLEWEAGRDRPDCHVEDLRRVELCSVGGNGFAVFDETGERRGFVGGHRWNVPPVNSEPEVAPVSPQNKPNSLDKGNT